MTYSNLSYSEYRGNKFDIRVEMTGLTSEKKYSMQFNSRKVTGIIEERTFISNAQGNAEISIELSDGESCSILDLPENANYRVTETAAAYYRPAYEITANDGAFILCSSDSMDNQNQSLSTSWETVDFNDYDIRILFTNTFDASGYVLPAAGLQNERMYFQAACSGMLLFAVMFLYINRKKIKKAVI